MISNLREMIDNKSLIGQTMGSYTVSDMDDFSYTDPIDNSLSQRQVGSLKRGSKKNQVVFFYGMLRCSFGFFKNNFFRL